MITSFIDGNSIAATIRHEVKDEVDEFIAETGRRPVLGVVLANNSTASHVYVTNKVKACASVGIDCKVWEYHSSHVESPAEYVRHRLELLQNGRDHYDGVIVQLPVTGVDDRRTFYDLIMPTKDVDCFHPENVGLVCQNKPRFVPCTPAGIIELLKRSSITVTGRQVTIINNSDIVGKPLAMMLTNMGATVGLCHHQSELDDIQRLCHASHIIIVAVGKPGFFTAEHMGRHGCTIIDVGISRISNKIVGDVDPNVYKIRPDAQYTPVPGGIGPMTVSMLLKNTIKAAWGQYR